MKSVFSTTPRLMRWALLAANVGAPAVWLLDRSTVSFATMAAVHALTLWATLWPGCTWWGPQVKKLSTDKKAVWLTLDDGPDPECTPAVLAALAEHHATATFFLIGEKAARHPHLVAAILAAGHSIAHHTQTHPQHWFWTYGPRQTARELDAALTAFAQLNIPRPRWFRAPAGFRNFFLHPALAARGLTLAGWTARGLDGRDNNVDRILARLLTRLRPGAILLLHEGKRTSAGRSLAAQTVPRLLQELTGRGYRAGRLSC